MNIKELIPQREPFLFIDKVLESSENEIKTTFHLRPELDFFKGHFPNNPIVPGVILSESCFQSAAALIAITAESNKNELTPTLAVVSRIQEAKFKKMVKPNDTVTIKTTLIEKIANAAYFKGDMVNQDGKKILTIKFACTVVTEE